MVLPYSYGIYMYQIYAFGFRYFGVFGFSFLIIFIALLLVGNVFALRDLDEFTFVESKYLGYKNVQATKKLLANQKGREIFPSMSKSFFD